MTLYSPIRLNPENLSCRTAQYARSVRESIQENTYAHDIMTRYTTDDIDEHDTANRENITRASIGVEAFGAELFGAITIESKRPLTAEELEAFAQFVSRVYREEWGPLFEEVDIACPHDETISVTFLNGQDDDWFLLTEGELSTRFGLARTSVDVPPFRPEDSATLLFTVGVVDMMGGPKTITMGGVSGIEKVVQHPEFLKLFRNRPGADGLLVDITHYKLHGVGPPRAATPQELKQIVTNTFPHCYTNRELEEVRSIPQLSPWTVNLSGGDVFNCDNRRKGRVNVLVDWSKISRESLYVDSRIITKLAGNDPRLAKGLAFPINEDEMMAALGMLRDPRCRSFRVMGLSCEVTELQSLVGKEVDVDDLNYLAKRLESLNRGQVETYRAMLQAKPDMSIQAMIDATFTQSNYVLVKDFTDFAAIGRSMRAAETGGFLEMGDCCEDGTPYVEKGKEILRNMPTPTTHGMLYCVGEITYEQYDGLIFPPYSYDGAQVVEVGLTLRDVVEGSSRLFWAELPAAAAYLESVAMRLGGESVADLHIGQVYRQSPALEMLEDRLNLQQEDLADINHLCGIIYGFDSRQEDCLLAAVPYCGAVGARQIARVAEIIDQFQFIPGVRTAEEYGRYLIQDSGLFEYDENLECAYNYADFGRMHMTMEQGRFTGRGYVAYMGTEPQEELIRPPDLEQSQEPPTMEPGMG